MTRFLITLSCFFLCATLGAAMALFSGWPIGVLSGALAFLFTQQATASIARRRDKRANAREIATLRQMTLEFEEALAGTRHRMDDLSQQLEARSDAQGKKIVSELRMLEGLMREFASRVSKSARAAQDEIGPAQTMRTGRRQGSAAQYLAGMGDRELLDVIRASLEENRVDLYLQPIVSLPQRKLRFYEALSRLRAEDGSVIMPAQYIKVAAPAGLMSVVDNLLLFRCVQIVRRLTQKSKDIAIFCNISGDTLTDAEFFPQFLDYMQANRDLAGQIVFEFAQGAVLEAGAAGAQNLSRLAGLGFALSMDHVETLALDFVRLKSMGVRHLKVRADMLTSGMNGAGAAVAAEDFKKLLSRHGLNLIVEHVEDEKTVVQLLDYAVDFAQGFLFGEPRAVRDEPGRVQADIPSVVPLKRAS
jgi:cyclic-di-GMP phosphodiesterase TipF (flagellum assembly factor)